MITKKEEEVMENINEVDTDEDFSGIPEKKVSTPESVGGPRSPALAG